MSNAYRQVFDYLINNHDELNPATPAEIIANTGISRPSVYRLLTKKLNGTSPDETASAGIFIAPETFTVHGQRSVKTYYADATRITSKDALRELTESITAKIKIKTPNQYVVKPVHLTPAILRGIKEDREAIYTVIDSQPTVEELFDIALKIERITEREVKNWTDLHEMYNELKKNYQESQENGAIDSETWKRFAEAIALWRAWFAKGLITIEILMQDPQFGKFAMLTPDRKIPDIGAPIIKEVK